MDDASARCALQKSSVELLWDRYSFLVHASSNMEVQKKLNGDLYVQYKNYKYHDLNFFWKVGYVFVIYDSLFKLMYNINIRLTSTIIE